METILVANRGEIACRVLRTAHRLGYRTVAVFSDADAHAPHVSMADEAVNIGPAPVAESYLSAERILDAAQRSGADAIHPGYGFLSEDADFAQACNDAGLTFIGPSPHAISAMGDKAQARARVMDSGVPCVPGFSADDPSDAELLAAAPQVGFPLLVKAAAGGGGRGMRRVDGLEALPDAIRSARAEAQNAFGDGTVLLERLITGARHVEIQVVADAHGNTLHLGERDCSVQRRHQKVIEEAPSPAVDAALRERMGAVACAAARSVDYTGVGTVEFLLDDSGSFYFLEMNTRLQVEHPVTEAVTGLDLVAMQLRIAEGAPLQLTQDDVTLSGHAIEARLYAEDPAAEYRPQTGQIVSFVPACGEGVRTDHGITAPGEVTAHYDPMIAKVIAHGADRAEACRRLHRALRETVLLGLRSNRGLLERTVQHPAFAAGQATTTFLQEHPTLVDDPTVDPQTPLVAAALLLEGQQGFRVAHATSQPLHMSLDGERTEVSVQFGRSGLMVNGHLVTVQRQHPSRARVTIDGLQRTVITADGGWFQHRSVGHQVAFWKPQSAAQSAAGDGRISAPMAARVLDVPVSVGDVVEAETVVVIVEAMKLETRLTAGTAGCVTAVRVAAGETVSSGQLLVVVEGGEQ